MIFIKNKYLAGALMSCPGLLHVTVQHNLAVETSEQLHKNKDHRKKCYKNFVGKIKFSLNIYEI